MMVKVKARRRFSYQNTDGQVTIVEPGEVTELPENIAPRIPRRVAERLSETAVEAESTEQEE